MSKSVSHKRAQQKAAGKDGRTEVPIKGGQKLDALSASGKKATEVERCGNVEAAAKRLQKVSAPQKVLQVPQKDMGKAAKAMKDVGVKGTVKNLSGTKRRSV